MKLTSTEILQCVDFCFRCDNLEKKKRLRISLEWKKQLSKSCSKIKKHCEIYSFSYCLCKIEVFSSKVKFFSQCFLKVTCGFLSLVLSLSRSLSPPNLALYLFLPSFFFPIIHPEVSILPKMTCRFSQLSRKYKYIFQEQGKLPTVSFPFLVLFVHGTVPVSSCDSQCIPAAGGG